MVDVLAREARVKMKREWHVGRGEIIALMRELPILFKGPMVRAILEGRKTLTRRIVKPQYIRLDGGGHPYIDMGCPSEWDGAGLRKDVLCPYGDVGDTLWVRETFAIATVHQMGGKQIPVYPVCDSTTDYGGIWKPSIHMPRWASRINLEVTGIRVERLQDITEEDAKAEGVRSPNGEWREDFYDAPDWSICPQCGGSGLYTYYHPETLGAIPDTDCCKCNTHKKLFTNLWESINGPGSWDVNPWVWVVEFKKL